MVDNPHDYVGVYRNSDGKELVFKPDGNRLLLASERQSIVLQHTQGDSFVSTVQGTFSDYSVVFGRDQPNSKGTEAAPAPPSPVVEVAYGPDWYVNTAYRGEREFKTPPEYAALTGRYRSDSGDEVRVFVRKGRLWAGDTQLTEIGPNLFRMGEDAWSPDTAQFLTIVEGRARLLRVIDEDCWRIEVDS